MHDDLKSFKQKTHTKNFAKTLLNLKNPKIFNNPQKLGHKRWNAQEMSEKESYQRKQVILRLKRVEKWFGVRRRCLERWEVRKDRERSGRNERKFVWTLYIKISVSRWIERCWELSRVSYWRAIERCPQQINFDGLRSYRAYRNFLDGSSSYRDWISRISMDRDCDNSYREKKLKKLYR